MPNDAALEYGFGQRQLGATDFALDQVRHRGYSRTQRLCPTWQYPRARPTQGSMQLGRPDGLIGASAVGELRVTAPFQPGPVSTRGTPIGPFPLDAFCHVRHQSPMLSDPHRCASAYLGALTSSFAGWRVARGTAVSMGLVLVGLACNSEEVPDCTVVRRVDTCCSTPTAIVVDDLGESPCEQSPFRAADVQACPAAQSCQGTACSNELFGASWTRLAESSGGQCEFASECETDADCILATNESICCSCPEAIPSRLPSNDPCWVPVGQQAPPNCAACQEVLACSACPSAAAAVPRCVRDATPYAKCLLQ